MKKYLHLYQSGGECKTIKYDTLEERDELLSKEYVVKHYRSFRIGSIIWNTGEEPFDLTKEDVETLIKREIEHIKSGEKITKYCNRWRWLYITTMFPLRLPFILLECIFSLIKVIFELGANAFEWIHEGIDRLGNKVFDFPMRHEIDTYFNSRNSEERDLYLIQKNRHDAIYGENKFTKQ